MKNYKELAKGMTTMELKEKVALIGKVFRIECEANGYNEKCEELNRWADILEYEFFKREGHSNIEEYGA